MIFILSKVLLFLIKPLIWSCCLFIFALFNKSAWKRKRLLIAGVVVLLLFSNGFIFGKVANAYEADYPPNDTYDVGIVLGGFSGINTGTTKSALPQVVTACSKHCLCTKKEK